MKFIISILLLLNLAYAKHDIYYNEIKLGVIDNIYTIKDNYFKIKVTNSLARLLLGTKYVVFHNELYKNKSAKNTTYKKDINKVIDILNEIILKNSKNVDLKISNTKEIKIRYNKTYTYEFLRKGKIQQKGTLDIKNNKLISLINISENIKILKH